MTLLAPRRPKNQLQKTQFDQGKSITLPAPTGGINLRDDIGDMKPNEARVLENWLPTTGQVSLRPGKTAHGTGMGTGEVKTLVSFVGYSASKLISGANGKIYDVSSPGAATQLATGFTQDRWQTAVYSNRLQLVNGADTPQVYDGATVAAIAWSGAGLTNTNLINVALVRNRLWFCELNQAWVWYGAIGQVTAASALTKFDASQVAGGGYCMAVASWSRDAGDGADDLTVFIMSTGELIIYQGDPATTFTLIGKFHAAPPIGRQCAFSVGGELVIITTQGLLPVSTAIGGTVTGQDIAAIDPWGKAAPGLAADAALDATNAGWHGVFDRGLVYINVPQEPGMLSKQWILNTRNGAWTTYTGLNGSSWCVHSGTLYIGMMTGGTVLTHTGASDAGTSITAIANCAFVYAAKSRSTNLFTAIRPKIKAVGSVSGVLGVDVDFDIRALSTASVTLSTPNPSSAWETSPWEVTSWGSDPVTAQLWYSVNGLGKAVSVRLTATASSEDVQWFATDVLYKVGGIR